MFSSWSITFYDLYQLSSRKNCKFHKTAEDIKIISEMSKEANLCQVGHDIKIYARFAP